MSVTLDLNRVGGGLMKGKLQLTVRKGLPRFLNFLGEVVICWSWLSILLRDLWWMLVTGWELEVVEWAWEIEPGMLLEGRVCGLGESIAAELWEAEVIGMWVVVVKGCWMIESWVGRRPSPEEVGWEAWLVEERDWRQAAEKQSTNWRQDRW